MPRILIDNLKMGYDDHIILDIEHLTFDDNDKVGLVGVNGCGKSTLLNILSGTIDSYKGKISKRGKIAYFRQFAETQIEIHYNKLTSKLGINHLEDGEKTSRGEKTKIRLANTLNQLADMYLLDEPDANLDYDGKQKLKQELGKLDSFILITHDETILNDCCNIIWYLDHGKITKVYGNYQKFKELQELDQITKKREYENYISEKARLEGVLEKKVQKAQSISKKTAVTSDTKARKFGALGKSFDGKQKSLMKASKNIEKRISHLEVKEDVKSLEKVKMSGNHFDSVIAKNIITAEDFSFSYGSHVIFDKCNFHISKGSKVAIIGENGSGKSTLLNQIVSRSKAVYIAPKVKIGYVMQNFEDLDPDKTILEVVQEKSIQNDSVNRTVLRRLLFKELDLRKMVSVLSGGEKMRCSIARLLVSDCNVLVLDEPTNYLDIYTIDALERLFEEYQGNIIFVTHDAAFIEKVATDLLEIGNKKIKTYHGALHDYKSKQQNINKTLLELKLVELSEKMKSASDKEKLEQEYTEVLNSLRNLR